MKNHTLSLGVPLAIAAISIGYYFAIYLPARGDAELLFSKQQHCGELGKSYREWEEREGGFSMGSYSVSVGVGRHAYSKKLDTCLYSNDKYFSGPATSKTEYYVIDLNTNTKLASYVHWDQGCEDCNLGLVINNRAQYDEIIKDNFATN